MKDFSNQQPTQKVVFGREAHEKLLEGAAILAKAVSSTLGPSGLNVIIDTPSGPPIITKDGVTVAKSINLKNRLQSMGAELLKEIASKTNELAGDGTTTSTVLGYAILKDSYKMITSGRNPVAIKRGMDIVTEKIINHLKENSIQIRNKQDVINVGTISANGDKKIGELLADAIEKVGSDGIITLETAKSVNTTLEVVEGMQFDSGYVSAYFITNQEKLQAELINPYILITNKKIASLQELLPILESVAKQQRSLLIIGDEIEGEALQALVLNKMKGVINVCAIKAPSYGENRSDILSDIAIITGGTVFDTTSGTSLKNITTSDLGTSKKVIVKKNNTIIVGDPASNQKNKILERITSIKNSLQSGTLDDLHVDRFKKRLAKLSGGVAIIKIGGSTEVEILEKKDRVEDALNATVAAVQEGIVPGGGTALFYSSSKIYEELQEKDFSGDEWAGIEIIFNACGAPLRTIIENTGKGKPDVVITTLETSRKNYRFGYDASKDKYLDLIEAGVIDPVKVTRMALEYASSVIGLVITCNAVVVNEVE